MNRDRLLPGALLLLLTLAQAAVTLFRPRTNYWPIHPYMMYSSAKDYRRLRMLQLFEVDARGVRRQALEVPTSSDAPPFRRGSYRDALKRGDRSALMRLMREHSRERSANKPRERRPQTLQLVAFFVRDADGVLDVAQRVILEIPAAEAP